VHWIFSETDFRNGLGSELSIMIPLDPKNRRRSI
jgi:hypothetical protein